MTALDKRKSRLIIPTNDAVREQGRIREVIVEAHPYHATLRLKGLKHTYQVSWVAIYQMAVRIQVENERREKKAAKRVR